jgi:hypothetical protein
MTNKKKKGGKVRLQFRCIFSFNAKKSKNIAKNVYTLAKIKLTNAGQGSGCGPPFSDKNDVIFMFVYSVATVLPRVTYHRLYLGLHTYNL